MVIWIIGKSGAGKTFLADKLYRKLKKDVKKIKWIDGDRFRKKYSKDLGYTKIDRKKNSLRIQHHCRDIEKKGYLVICSILSIFRDHQKKNRKLFNKYFQVFIRVDNTRVIKRNKKKIYSKKYNVVGQDIKFTTPYKSHIIIKNNFDYKFSKNVGKIAKRLYEFI